MLKLDLYTVHTSEEYTVIFTRLQLQGLPTTPSAELEITGSLRSASVAAIPLAAHPSKPVGDGQEFLSQSPTVDKFNVHEYSFS